MARHDERPYVAPPRPAILRGENVLSELSMSKPLVVSIPHNLGQEEALRRIHSGIGRAKERYASFGTVDEETWTGNHLAFQVSALKQHLRGEVVVGPEDVTLTMALPWILTVMAEKMKAKIGSLGVK